MIKCCCLQKKKFEGKLERHSIGWTNDGLIQGLSYFKYQTPVILNVETNQTSSTYGRNPRTGEYEDYFPEGNFPTRAVDSEAQIEMLGYWVNIDPLLAAMQSASETCKWA